MLSMLAVCVLGRAMCVRVLLASRGSSSSSIVCRTVSLISGALQQPDTNAQGEAWDWMTLFVSFFMLHVC
jgi:hypothetical protein